MVGMPATSTLSLTKVGTPAKKPPRGSARPRAGAVGVDVGDGAEPRVDRAVRASAASTTSGIDTRRDRTSSARPTASSRPRASSENACTRAMGGR